MNMRTDLAIEQREMLPKGSMEGIKSHEFQLGCAHITRIEITNKKGAERLGRGIGKYTTVELPSFKKDAQLLDDRLDAVSNEIASLLPKSGTVLVAGLGNEQITPDALGPKAAEMIFSTRHISEELSRSIGFGKLRPVARITPGVLGQNGVETGEILAGVVDRIKPCAVITIDALASRRLSRLGCTVQMANTGVVPGSGVGNARCEISERTLGVPVIAIGVPTVVDASTLAMDLLREKNSEKADLIDSLEPCGSEMMVTPREIDLVIERAARLIALAVNCALQPDIEPQDILSLVT